MSKTLTDAVPLDDDEPIDGGTPNEDEAAAGDTPTDAAAGAEDTDPAAGDDDADADAEALRAVAGDGEEDPGDEDDPTAVTGTRIPKARFDEVNEARKQAQAETQQLRQLLTQLVGQQGTATATKDAPKPRDFDAEYDALMAQYDAGEIDEGKFRRAERRLSVEQAKVEMASQFEPKLRELENQREIEQQQRVQVEWTQAVADAIKTYPFLNHEGREANREAIAAVRAECEELMQAGIPAARALRLAVRDVAPEYGTAAPPSTDKMAAERKAAARKAAAEAETRQPSTLGGVGNGVRTQGKQHLTASVSDHDKWEDVPEEQREQAFTA